MKAQTRLAVGLSTALTLAAAAVWLTMDPGPQPIRHAAEPSPLESWPVEPRPTSGADAPAAPENPVPPYIAEIQERYPHLSVEEIEAIRQADMYSRGKHRIFQRCQWGRTAKYDEDGKQVGESCLKSPQHDYTNETLEVLAYSDGEAARVLAMRLRHSDYDRALKLALRSIALSGGDAEILTSAEMWQPVASESPDAELLRLHQQYVVHSLRDLVEYGEYRRFPPYVNRISDATNDPEATLIELDKLVYELYDEIKQIEIDVTGRSSFGGDDDV